MSFPTPAKQALEKLKQGPVQITVDGVEVFVRGGATVNLIRGQANAETDLVGIYDIYSTGDGATVELACEEESSNILAVLLGDYPAGSGYHPFGKAAGASARASAKAIRIRPWQMRNASTVQLDLWKCVPEGDAVKAMTPDAPWRYTQTLRALPDLTKANGELIGKITAPARS